MEVLVVLFVLALLSIPIALIVLFVIINNRLRNLESTFCTFRRSQKAAWEEMRQLISSKEKPPFEQDGKKSKADTDTQKDKKKKKKKEQQKQLAAESGAAVSSAERIEKIEPQAKPSPELLIKEVEIIKKTEIKPEPKAIPKLQPVPKVEMTPVHRTEIKDKKTPPVQKKTASEFEKKAQSMLHSIWMWFLVGEDHRRKGVSAEYAVATTWLVRMGILILLAGGAFFLKYSIDHGLMPPVFRVAGSVIAALGMLVAGMKFSGSGKKYDLIARGSLGGGIALLYFSTHAASNMYKLLDRPVAFGIMILITIAAWIISVRRDSLLVAVFGVIGGTITPVILSTGVKNLPGLYTYMLLLAVGTLGISHYRNWKLLNILSFLFTWGIYLLALNKYYHGAEDYAVAITFLCIYFVVFFGQSIIFNIRNCQPVTLVEMLLILANTLLYFAIGWEKTLSIYPSAYGAAFSLGAAVFFTAFIVYFLYRKYHDKALLLILLAFAGFSITVSVPLLLSGKWITASWSALAVLFLWLGLRIGSRFLAQSSYVIYALSFFRIMLFDQSFTRHTTDYFLGLQDRFITIGGFLIALVAGRWIMKKYGDFNGLISQDNDVALKVPNNYVIKQFFWGSAVLLCAYLTLEAVRFSGVYYLPLREPLVTSVWAVALVLLAVYSKKQNSRLLANLVMLVTFCLFLRLGANLNIWKFSTSKWIYDCRPFWGYTFMRGLDCLLLLGAFSFGWLSVRKRIEPCLGRCFGGFILVILFFYLTFETSSLLYHFVRGFRAGGVSILWGVFAFAMIFFGITKGNKELRYSALLLLLIDVYKIFFIDLKHLSQLYRIIAFIVLGLVLIAGAFIYIRFRAHFETGSEDKKLKG
ncbi:MAG: DUF2339 domain-containing protein [Lentisphaerae bacterium]|nr:DUF2339 domain-containing protein [Lentisphaerota bacterium]MCP4099894.1 DUF2339 domain-containing protein [Lentisphaerota bacterium]